MSNAIKPILKGSFTSDFESQAIAKGRLEKTSIQLNLAGDAVISASIVQSNDGINWADVPSTDVSGVDSSDSPLFWNLNEGNPKFYKVKVTVTSGEADVEIFVN